MKVSGPLKLAGLVLMGLTPGALITPGFGGRVHYPTGKGFITMQVVPAPKSR